MGTSPRRPVTVNDLVADLERLGARPWMTLLVHCSLSALGWVVGGEQAVVAALRGVLGQAGTLVMPTQSWQLCDPAYLNAPDVPRAWWPMIREHLPAYRTHYPGKHTVRNGGPLLVAGRRSWVPWEELWVADGIEVVVGDAFATHTGLQQHGQVGQADARLLPQQDLVDFAAGWFAEHRTADQFGTDTTAWR
jgi:aminoglycoside N3'-acetyltransferase